MKIKNCRLEILQTINEKAGWRLGNIQRGVGSSIDKELVDEALGFRSLCLFSGLDDKELKRLWDESNLNFSL